MQNTRTLFYWTDFEEEISDIASPEKFNYPFCYEPHQLALIAAKQLQNYIVNKLETVHHFGSNETQGIGKMFGVLVVKNQEGILGFLAAFSGKMGNSNHYEGFVPPVFDVLDPEGFYKEGEAKTNAVNREIEKIQDQKAY
jgi:tRNA pseudouridine32 synthase/23S rRNA pseudouridine746 synthase